MRNNRHAISPVRSLILALVGAATLIGLLGVGPAGQQASATTVMKLDTAGLTTNSQWVVRAKVVSIDYVDLRADGRGLFTDITLAVSQVVRGKDVPSTVTMRLPGGVATDGMAVTVPGMPRFMVSEDVVVFLEKTSMGHVPAGLGQGVWRVMPSPIGPSLVQQSTRGLHMVQRDAKGKLASVQTHKVATTTLLQLVARVRAVR